MVPQIKQPVGQAIWALQNAMRELPQAQLETEHYFADGMYCRFLPRPAGCLIVGKVHKKEHFYIICSGTVRITSGESEAVEITGPRVIVSQPGTKRAVYAVTDAVCLTVHRADTQDLDELERQIIEPDDTALFDARNDIKAIT
jgi:hypothetical protein